MSQKVDIMFMKNYFPKIGTSFGNRWSQTIALHFAENIPTYIEKSRPIWYSPSHRPILENRENIGGKIIVANIYENLSSIFLNNSLPYIKLPVGL